MYGTGGKVLEFVAPFGACSGVCLN